MNYSGDTSSLSSDIIINKILWNSVLLTPDAQFMTLDIKDFYLMQNLKYEYIFIPLELIPEDFIEKYNLQNIACALWLQALKIHTWTLDKLSPWTTIHISS